MFQEDYPGTDFSSITIYECWKFFILHTKNFLVIPYPIFPPCDPLSRKMLPETFGRGNLDSYWDKD